MPPGPDELTAGDGRGTGAQSTGWLTPLGTFHFLKTVAAAMIQCQTLTKMGTQMCATLCLCFSVSVLEIFIERVGGRGPHVPQAQVPRVRRGRAQKCPK